VGFNLGHDRSAVLEAAAKASKKAAESKGRVCLIIVETPANPTNSLVDLKLMREVSDMIGSRPERRAAARGGRQYVSGTGLSAAVAAWR